MTRIKNTDEYPIKASPVAGDMVIGSDSENNGETVNFLVEELIRGDNSTIYTVATLPSGTVGDRASVTDATTPTYLGTLTGGGAVVCPVFYNGSAWVSA